MPEPLPKSASPASPPELTSGPGAMSFRQHLAELRRRLIICFVVLTITTLGAFLLAPQAIFLLKALAPRGTLFVQLSPGEVFMASAKLSLFAGFGLSLPVILYHTFRFVSPGLHHRERFLLFPMLIFGLGLFVAGVAFCYWAILPLMLDFLLSYGQEIAQNQLSVAAFLDFCMGFLIAGGLVFQLPLVLLFCAFMGLTSSAKLIASWRWAAIIAFIAGAVITPSVDVASQIVMSASLIGLYAFSIVLLKVFRK